MYAVKSDGETVGYSDGFVFIRLHSNGCYVLCSEADAEGICVKIARQTVNENGETVTYIDDTVFTLADGGMHGTEPKGELEAVSGAQLIANKDSEINDILTELETEAKA